MQNNKANGTKLPHADILKLSKAEVIERAKAGYVTMDDPAYKPAWQDRELQDFNLVLEGGGFRGQFTAGVLDLFMDEGIFPKTAIGVSAGALNGSNYAAGMRGRTNFLNTNYCDYWRYYSMRSLVLKGDAFDSKFTFDEMLHETDPFDFESLYASPIKLITVGTDLNTGKADFHTVGDVKTDIAYLKASASMPLVSRVVHVDGKLLLDGGVADSVPLAYSLELTKDITPARKQVVVLTQDASYVKGANKLMWLSRLLYRKSPNFVEAMARRHLVYNELYAKLPKMHERGEIFLIRPPRPVTISSMEKDKRELYALYLSGYEEAKRNLTALKAFLDLAQA